METHPAYRVPLRIPQRFRREACRNRPARLDQKRALKASIAFQKYRILNVITNLRIRRKGEEPRPLTVSEKQDVYELLTTAKEDVEWLDVCAVLDIERNELKGVGTLTHDGEERIGNKPPVLDTVIRLHGIKNTKLRKMMDAWWDVATEGERAAMIRLLSNTIDLDKVRDLIEYASPIEFIDGLDEDLLTPLDSISLPVGRAAYSEKTLTRLSKRMLETEDDLHYAIRHEFNVPADWKPPVPPVQEPTGNPAVDRVLKAFNRFLSQCEQQYGIPESVSIETTKESFSSIAFGRTLDYERRQRRDKDNQMRAAIREDMKKQLSNGGSFKSTITISAVGKSSNRRTTHAYTVVRPVHDSVSTSPNSTISYPVVASVRTANAPTWLRSAPNAMPASRTFRSPFGCVPTMRGSMASP